MKSWLAALLLMLPFLVVAGLGSGLIFNALAYLGSILTLHSLVTFSVTNALTFTPPPVASSIVWPVIAVVGVIAAGGLYYLLER